MIIQVRGNNASGKSTVVRTVLQKHNYAPVYGLLGPKMPEAYRCSPEGKLWYILGPYGSGATAGMDYVTKKGVAAFVAQLDKYHQTGGSLVFESIMTSIRFVAPTIGAWLEAHKDEVRVLTLNTTPEQCLEAMAERQKTSIVEARANKHFWANQKMFERVTDQIIQKGFCHEYVSREDAPGRVLQWLER